MLGGLLVPSIDRPTKLMGVHSEHALAVLGCWHRAMWCSEPWRSLWTIFWNGPSGSSLETRNLAWSYGR